MLGPIFHGLRHKKPRGIFYKGRWIQGNRQQKSSENGYNLLFFCRHIQKIQFKKLDKHIFIRQLPNATKLDYMGNYERLFPFQSGIAWIFFNTVIEIRITYVSKCQSRDRVRSIAAWWWKGGCRYSYLPTYGNNLRGIDGTRRQACRSLQTAEYWYPLGMKNGLTIRQDGINMEERESDLRSRLQWSNNFSNTWTPSHQRR